jgi:hypothetical protein
LDFKIKEKIKTSKHSKKGILTIKRLIKSGDENKQPTIKQKRTQNFLLLII